MIFIRLYNFGIYSRVVAFSRSLPLLLSEDSNCILINTFGSHKREKSLKICLKKQYIHFGCHLWNFHSRSLSFMDALWLYNRHDLHKSQNEWPYIFNTRITWYSRKYAPNRSFHISYHHSSHECAWMIAVNALEHFYDIFD